MIYELAALGAATCWAMTGIISVVPANHLGAFAFGRLRQLFVTAVLGVYVLSTGVWQQLNGDTVPPLLLSGLIGVFLGDTLLFAALNRLGPRRCGILFSLNAPISAVLGFVFLGEKLALQAVGGIALIVSGVALAIFYGRRKRQSHAWEQVRGPLWIGILLGLGAATGQAVGAIIARPVMESGIDPFLASMLRVGTAGLCLSLLMALPIASVKPLAPLNGRIAVLACLSAFIALAVGMTLLLFALSGGKVGIVTTLSATSPVLILPLLWARTGERPALGAWAGAALVIAGMALLFVR